MEDLVTLAQDWRGRCVFLTGHTGFKGSWLVKVLAKLGATVHGFALPAPARGLYTSARVDRLMASSTEADICRPGAVSQALAASGADTVIHMAAQPLVRQSYADPVETYATNVMGTVYLLDAVRQAPTVRSCVVVTSDKCYENNEWDWGYRENEAMGGFDPYSNSKGCAELVTSAYRRSFFAAPGAVRIASGRAGNVIGGGDWSADRLVPDLVSTFARGEATMIRHPHAIRPWQHVLEPLFGYLTLAAHLSGDDGRTYADGWNFGPNADSERTVGDVVAAVAGRWGDDARWAIDASVQPHEAGFLKLDSSKARQRLSWRPAWSFHEAIEQTVAWYHAERAGQDMAEFTENQIDAYLAARSKVLGEWA